VVVSFQLGFPSPRAADQKLQLQESWDSKNTVLNGKNQTRTHVSLPKRTSVLPLNREVQVTLAVSGFQGWGGRGAQAVAAPWPPVRVLGWASITDLTPSGERTGEPDRQAGRKSSWLWLGQDWLIFADHFIFYDLAFSSGKLFGGDFWPAQLQSLRGFVSFLAFFNTWWVNNFCIDCKCLE